MSDIDLQALTIGSALGCSPVEPVGVGRKVMVGAKLVLKFFARGDAKTQGSVRPLPSRQAIRQGKRLTECRFGEMVMTSDTKDLKLWRAIVGTEGRTAIIRACNTTPRANFNPLRDALWPSGPVRLILIWKLPRPQKAPARPEHATRPDLDKLERAVLDALAGVLYADDGQVQTVVKQKFVAGVDETPGVEVTAWQ